MEIHYIQPLERAYDRMRRALFMPFDLGKWLAVGFTVFLADLLSGRRGSSFSYRYSKGDIARIAEWPEKAIEWLRDHPVWLVVIVFGVIAVILLIALLTWLSSRGVFMFLDNVVHDRADVVAPWRAYRNAADSLFLFRLCLGLAAMVLLVGAGFGWFFLIRPEMSGEFPAGPLALLILLILAAALLSLIWSLVSFFTASFVVPIMYKHNLAVLDAWGRFASLLSSNPWPFLLFAIITAVILVGTMLAAVVAGCLTCCIGLLLLSLPYIGSVILLPVWYTLRAYSLEFLAQWGPEYTLFPAVAPPQPPPPIP
jgi:hypothetical protein